LQRDLPIFRNQAIFSSASAFSRAVGSTLSNDSVQACDPTGGIQFVMPHK